MLKKYTAYNFESYDFIILLLLFNFSMFEKDVFFGFRIGALMVVKSRGDFLRIRLKFTVKST